MLLLFPLSLKMFCNFTQIYSRQRLHLTDDETNYLTDIKN